MAKRQAAEAHKLGEILHDLSRERVVCALQRRVIRGALHGCVKAPRKRPRALVVSPQNLDRGRVGASSCTASRADGRFGEIREVGAGERIAGVQAGLPDLDVDELFAATYP